MTRRSSPRCDLDGSRPPCREPFEFPVWPRERPSAALSHRAQLRLARFPGRLPLPRLLSGVVCMERGSLVATERTITKLRRVNARVCGVRHVGMWTCSHRAGGRMFDSEHARSQLGPPAARLPDFRLSPGEVST